MFNVCILCVCVCMCVLHTFTMTIITRAICQSLNLLDVWNFKFLIMTTASQKVRAFQPIGKMVCIELSYYNKNIN